MLGASINEHVFCVDLFANDVALLMTQSLSPATRNIFEAFKKCMGFLFVVEITQIKVFYQRKATLMISSSDVTTRLQAATWDSER